MGMVLSLLLSMAYKQTQKRIRVLKSMISDYEKYQRSPREPQQLNVCYCTVQWFPKITGTGQPRCIRITWEASYKYISLYSITEGSMVSPGNLFFFKRSPDNSSLLIVVFNPQSPLGNILFQFTSLSSFDFKIYALRFE